MPVSVERVSLSSRPADASIRERELFAILLGLFGLILYPILRADRLYDDDLKRALIGRAGWDSNGRPLTTLLMRALQCYDHAMVDIAPLPQVAAIGVLAWTGVLLSRRFAGGSTWLVALAVFPLGAQPFFLENLSYHFDALSMSVAMLLASLPIVSIGLDRRGWWLGVLALFGALNFYQPAINLYLVFMLLETVMLQLRAAPGRELGRTLGLRAGQVLLGMAVYELLVGVHISGWVARQVASIRSWRELPTLWHNFAGFYAFVVGAFDRHWWLWFGPLLGVLAVIPMVVGVRYALARRARHPWWGSTLLLLMSVAMPVAAMTAALGPMLLLRKPEIEPRVLMGLGAMLCAGLLVMQEAFRRWGRARGWNVAAAVMLAVGMVVIASAYGNAMGAQKAYEERIAARLADDVAALAVDHPIHQLVVAGSAGLSPLSAHVASQFPLMYALVPVYLAQDDAFGTRGFLMYYVPDLVDPRQAAHDWAWANVPSLAARTCAMSPSAVSSSYRLFLVGDVAVVRFAQPGHDACGMAR